jgi:hypothetical protein
MAQMVEDLPSKLGALFQSSVPQKKERKKEEIRLER